MSPQEPANNVISMADAWKNARNPQHEFFLSGFFKIIGGCNSVEEAESQLGGAVIIKRDAAGNITEAQHNLFPL
jgi:hypothetical protein